ncbi:DASS family sodium-coupled anion symporter [Solibacillus sp. FSL W7-1472]|uniref:Sodium-dependent dicarboxylate transporter SdcS n=1 Tax=Solibacillus silvestris (strain StLB046) TaxID=1002809 RepID=F2F8Q3_SOLSS|nr:MULTISPECIES: DASS family sodium-coupled anion symporter [Solibacillus]MCM3723396.1 DASS family sodium-coupled anion symporter [Solibacillus isronensis]OBW51601.1 anion transporter [Solibacillus silvestris]BAK14994.1 di- and tricarboxylate transporters [Solibacillus silvestris StLB046]
MFSTTWNRLWEMHDQVKDMFTFFIKPNSSKVVSKGVTGKSGNENSGNGGGYTPRSYTTAQMIGLFLGPLLFVLTLLFFQPEGLSTEARGVLASTIWIATWWITEAIPIPATSLLPLVLFPLTNSLDMKVTASSYGDETIFLFMGGFIIALAMEKWNLHRRIAISIISMVGTNMDRIVLGFMIATGFLSMWISNTATAMMMIPIGLAIINQVADGLKNDPSIDTSPQRFAFGKALMLGIAYSASLGGIATLIGTPPNTLLAGAINKMYGIELSFAGWMLFGVPFAWIFIFVTWIYLVKIAFPSKLKTMPGGRAVIDKQKKDLGEASFEEKLVFIVFALAAFSWITRTFLLSKFVDGLTDGMIAVIFALVLFALPSANRKGERLMDWQTAVKLPWGILLLFGGGLAIASGFVGTGLSEWIGTQLMGLEGVSVIVLIFLVAALVLGLTEITSNTATASMMFPIMASLAVALGVHPYALMIAAGVAASCAFMLPVATPPNAAVFGSGYIKIKDMMKAGFALNVFGVVFITLAIYFLLPIMWDIDLNSVPEMFKVMNK